MREARRLGEGGAELGTCRSHVSSQFIESLLNDNPYQACTALPTLVESYIMGVV
jgi:hypothetical protein